MALSGQGADELLGGYQKHRVAAPPAIDRGGAAARVLAGAVARGAGGLVPGQWGRLRRDSRGERCRRSVCSPMSSPPPRPSPPRRGWGHSAVWHRGAGPAKRSTCTPVGCRVATGALPATLFLDAQLALVDSMLHYFDRMSMAALAGSPRAVPGFPQGRGVLRTDPRRVQGQGGGHASTLLRQAAGAVCCRPGDHSSQEGGLLPTGDPGPGSATHRSTA